MHILITVLSSPFIFLALTQLVNLSGSRWFLPLVVIHRINEICEIFCRVDHFPYDHSNTAKKREWCLILRTFIYHILEIQHNKHSAKVCTILSYGRLWLYTKVEFYLESIKGS